MEDVRKMGENITKSVDKIKSELVTTNNICEVAVEGIQESVGCAHYKRKSKFVTPCCNKIYYCRFCHDENETHSVVRAQVTELICTRCHTRQKLRAECEKCSLRFGKYTCLRCKLFDDNDNKQYHCDGCGICRVGGRDRFFHCETCNMCLPNNLLDCHKCVENMSRSNCPVCMEDIHTSRVACHIPRCGHLLHRPCFEDMLKRQLYRCPTCCCSLINMSKTWAKLDIEVRQTPMPDIYKYNVDIICRDCHKTSNIPFHVVGLKCALCGSYNTCRDKDAEVARRRGSQVVHRPGSSSFEADMEP